MDKKLLMNIGVNIGAFFATKKIYDSIFKHHRYSSKALGYSLDDFPLLARKRYEFKNVNGLKLVGYIYQKENINKNRLMVFAHGFGKGGHNRYLNLIEYFCRQGYYVFAYDATGNDESEGNDIKGFTQGYLDADKAISFVESLKEYKNLPLDICGHSWGAYSMSNALYLHPRVNALVAFSGFNKSTSIFKANGELYSPLNSDAFVNYVEDYERLLFKKDADSSALNSFENSNAKVVIIHSNDDKTVPPNAGIDLYEQEFRNNPRFYFIRLENKGHGTVYYSKEGKNYIDSFYRVFNKYVKDNKLNEEEQEKYASSILNRTIYNNLLDEKLLDNIIEFIR